MTHDMFNKLLLFCIIFPFETLYETLATADKIKLKNLPVTNNVRRLLEHTSVYVDKTPYMVKLVQRGLKYVFLTRPRRFGKTTFLKTLELIFDGTKYKQLFKGTHIYEDQSFIWRKHPILYMDFSIIPHSKSGELKEHLGKEMRVLTKSAPLNEKFEDQIKSSIYTIFRRGRGAAVILIDEYDQPINDAWVNGNYNLAKENRNVIRQFFHTLKICDRYIKLIFVTGVNKYSQASIFSEINQFYDISMDPDFVGIVGYTEKELHEHFQDHIRYVAKNKGMSEEEFKKALNQYYYGYKFSHRSNQSIYNPWSIVHCLTMSGAFDDHWFYSSKPQYIYQQIEKRGPPSFVNTTISGKKLQGFEDLNDISPVALMYHEGYYTIDKYDNQTDHYILRYPNTEIRGALKRSKPYM